MKPRTLFAVSVAAVSCAIAPNNAFAQTAFEYVGKIVCGPQTDSLSQAVVRGFYATVINVRNPGRAQAIITKRVTWMLPPGNETVVKPRNVAVDTLPGGTALAAECSEISKKSDISNSVFREGYFVITSAVPLDVTGVYTAAPFVILGKQFFGSGQVSTMHIERFFERKQ